MGDDLSFTLKLDFEIPDADLSKIGFRKCEIRPFKSAYRIGKGFLAFEGNFLRVSPKLEREELLRAISFLFDGCEKL
ncbi:MAG: hypothetical protein DSO00_05660 [Archaeoglobi archaeon]|nr:MAG: hypothetical protein DSO00_05660 [Archaeoglobi archaeon]